MSESKLLISPLLCFLTQLVQDLNRSQQDPSAKSNAVYTLKPHSTMPYAWDFPAARDKKILLTINGSRRVVDIMEIGDLVPFKFNVRLTAMGFFGYFSP